MVYVPTGRGTLPSLLLAFILIHSSSTILAHSADAGHTHMIFEDDFEDGTADAWEMWTPPDTPPDTSWAVLYDGGNNVLNLRGGVIAIAGDPTWTNYTLEARVKFVDGPDEAHINVRMGEPAPRYFVRLPQQDIYLTKDFMGEFPNLATSEMERGVDTWYAVKIVCAGSRFWVYVDDELKIEYEDDEELILSGRVGLESGPGTDVYFDDVRVYTTHRLYVTYLIGAAQDEINNARMVGADTSEAEEMFEKAQTKLAEGDLSGAEDLSREAASKATTSRIEKLSGSDSLPPDTRMGFTLSIEMVAGIVSIGAAGLGLVGWMARTRSVRRRGRILFNKLLEDVDDVYGRFKMNARRCEAELLRLKGDVLAGFKEGVIDEDKFHTLDARIDAYIRDVRKEIEREGPEP